MNHESQFAYTHVGTPYYMSPEQINESKYNEKSDIWALGCIVYELAALRPPFQAQNHLSLAVKIKAGKFERVPLRYSEELQRVVGWMLAQNPQERPAVEDLLNIPQVSLRIRDKKLQEAFHALRKKEDELRAWEARLEDRETQLQERESQLCERDALLSEVVKNASDIQNCGSSLMNSELIKSLQRLASTIAGESMLSVSERVSISSKLKESKMSATSFGTLNNSGSHNSR